MVRYVKYKYFLWIRLIWVACYVCLSLKTMKITNETMFFPKRTLFLLPVIMDFTCYFALDFLFLVVLIVQKSYVKHA